MSPTGDAEIGAAHQERIQKMISANYKIVQERVLSAARRSGRSDDAVQVMAVTKNFSHIYSQAALSAGLSLFGENRVQEATSKYSACGRTFELHLIGHLQRNKAQAAANLFDTVQSIDSIHTAVALERRCAAVNRTVKILLELNSSGESTKAGFLTENDLLAAAVEISSSCPHLPIGGLMTVGAHSSDEAIVRSSFVRLRAVHEQLLNDHPSAGVLSMGMSQDFELAIEEGATLIRLGEALLGKRPVPPQ